MAGPLTNEERFWAKVDKTDGCWNWTAAIQNNGYGHFSIRNGFKDYRSALAHRVVWELTNGPIPPGMQIDHLCRNRKCVNPEHLEVVTPGENVRRGISPAITRARWRSQTHCKRGHALAGDNIYIVPTTGSRQCMVCVRLRKEQANVR